MDSSTITLCIGIITCVIGVSTFVSGRMTKAERSGSMETKIDQALKGIEDLKTQLRSSESNRHNTDLMVRSHDEQIRTIFRQYAELQSHIEKSDKTNDLLLEMLHFMKEHHSA